MPLRVALYQPDIPQNTGTILRMAACFGLTVDIIEPTGFDMSDRAMKRAALDYIDKETMNRHRSWAAFQEWRAKSGKRLVLLTTSAQRSHTDFSFRDNDILLMGRESSGVPENVHEAADARVKIPIQAGLRSLNLAVATAIVTAEALRQTGGFPQ